LVLWVVASPFLLIGILAIHDMGAALRITKNLGDAAFAASGWARANSYDETEMVVAARSTVDLPRVTFSFSHPCGCTVGDGIASYKCDSTCPSGRAPRYYFVATASMCFDTLLAWPGVSRCRSGDSQCVAAGCTERQMLLSAQSALMQ
jgi:hypothetical protein